MTNNFSKPETCKSAGSLINTNFVFVLCTLIGLDILSEPVNGQSAFRPVDAGLKPVTQDTDNSSEPTRDPFARIAPPCSVNALPVAGQGDERKFQLKVTNTSDKTISRLVVRVYLFDGKEIVQEFSTTNDRWFGNEQGNELAKGESFVIVLESSPIPDDVDSVAGLAKSVNWKDGTEWPTYTGPQPDQEGDAPVTLRLKGIVHDGEFSAPLVEFFNHSKKDIERLEYQIAYLAENGDQLHQGRRTRLGDIKGGEGFAHVGEQGVPKEAAKVSLSLNFVNFTDGSRWIARD
ncbi:MAG: hypothetical protein AB7O62_18105 [Pirellulales bacterium]